MKTAFTLPRWALAAASAVLLCLPAVSQTNGPGTGISLDGATNAYLTLPSGVWFNGNFTVEAWVYTRAYNSWERLIDFSDGPNNYNVYLALSAGTGGYPTMGTFLANNSSPVLTANTQIPLNQWAHLAATLNGTTGTIYINGVNVGSGTLNVPPNVTRATNYIGRSAYSSDSYANAIYDEVRIWNVARTQAQIQSTMNHSLLGNEPGLIGYWRLDEGAGTTAADSSGHGQTATLAGGASWTNSTVLLTNSADYALSFNGTNGETFQAPHQAVQNAYPLTAMCWFKVPTNNTGGGGAFINKYVSGSLNGWQLFLGGQLHAWYYRDSGDVVGNTGAGAVNDNTWHHGAFVVDAGGGHIYLDGVLKQTVAWTGTPGPSTTTTPLSFGLYPGDSYLNAQMDEASVWNVALTQAQIQTYMHQPLLGTESGLIAYYRLNEGIGTNQYDFSTNSNRGSFQVTPATWILSGAQLQEIPQVATLPASTLGLTATLFGTINPQGENTGAWFNWGTSASYGNNTAVSLPGASYVLATNSTLVNGLAPGTYHFRVEATNASGTNFGLDQTFSVAAILATVNNTTASNITSTGATLTASVNPNGSSTTVSFAYGLTTNYGTTNAAGNIGSGGSAVLASNNISGLLPVTIYHYLALASNSAGVARGADSTFQTTGSAPVVTNETATSLAQTSATLNASVNPEGLVTTVYFVHGPTASYGATNSQALAGGTNAVAVSTNLTGLVVGDTYHYEIIASNSVGVAYGGDQTFTTPVFLVVSAGVSAPIDVYENMVWGDYNNDGWLDILAEQNIWRNNANGTFGSVSLGEPRVTYGTMAWGDYDNDGNLDILYTGLNESTYGPFTELWHNNGDGTFTLANNTGLPNLQFGSAVFADFDNDGFADLLLMGSIDNDDHYTAGIWHNNGNGTFSQISIPGLQPGQGALAVGDFDNDGYMDFIVVNDTVQLWHNNGNGTFTSNNIPGLPQLYNPAIAVGDFNNDGYPDFAITGQTYLNGSFTYISQIWSNNGNFTFSEDTQVSLPGIWQGTVAWGDYDNDGQLDLFLSGATGADQSNEPISPITQIWRNLGHGNFANINASLTGYEYASGVWGDFNNDGRLDLLYSGYASGQIRLTLLQNAASVTNTPPTAPAGLQAAPDGNVVVLTWNAAGDAQTPAAGLSYNIRVGTNSGGINIVAPAADPGNGYRRLVQTGNAQQRTFFILTNLAAGNYFWSVQAIDTAYAGSPFATEGQFTVTGLPPSPLIQPQGVSGVTDASATLNARIYPEASAGGVWFQWGTDTNYGQVTTAVAVGSAVTNIASTLIGLTPGTTYHYQAVATNANGLAMSPDLTFTTLSAPPPALAPLAVSNVTTTTAILNALVNAEGDYATVYFAYGTDATYGATNTVQIPNATNAVVVPSLLTGLTAGTLYHYLVMASNSGGIVAGTDGVFQTLAAPAVVTLPASGLAATSAILNGSVNPEAADTRAYFVYGADTNYGSATAMIDIGSGTSAIPVSNLLSGLTGGVTYHFAVAASNSVGVRQGADAMFTTPAGVPVLTTLAASNVMATSVNLNALVNPSGAPTSVYIAYGPTAIYTKTNLAGALGSGSTLVLVSDTLSGLSVVTGYHYKFIASNSVGIVAAPDSMFTTLPLPPAVTTLPVSNITAYTATLNATVNPGGVATAVYFLYGTDSNYGPAILAANLSGTNTALVTNNLSGLDGGVLYHFEVLASNSVAEVTGPDSVFQAAAGLPVLTTLAVSNITAGAAALAAEVDPSGADTTVYFLYGPTANYGLTNMIDAGGASNAIVLLDNLSNLTVNTTYHFLVIASNRLGRVAGTDAIFATPPILGAVNAGLPAPDAFNIGVAWADFNNNDFLDLGINDAFFWNDEDGTFSYDTTVSSGNIYSSASAWGDFDNDGLLDYLLVGTSSGAGDQIWHNNGDGTFTALSSPGLPSFSGGQVQVALGDFNNDGLLDIFYIGSGVAGIWTNVGDGSFSQWSIPSLPQFNSGSAVAVGDFNRDGFLDFMISGQQTTNAALITMMWRNNGDGTFTPIPLPGVVGFLPATLTVADFNNDGWLDFVVGGSPGSGPLVSQLWTNGGNWNFAQNTTAVLPGVANGQVSAGDYDNDGWPDLAFLGLTNFDRTLDDFVDPITAVFHNNGDGTFSNINANLPPLTYGSVNWGDYDNDGRLDLLVEGSPDDGSTNELFLEHNNSSAVNTPPTAPTGLQTITDGTLTILVWNASTDAQTPSAGLSYNIRVGRSPGGVDVVSPGSDQYNGFRRLPQIGNAQGKCFAIVNLPGGFYFWSVQAIDSSFAGSPWAAESYFGDDDGQPGPLPFTLPATAITNGGATLNGTVNPENQGATVWFDWGTTTGYGNSTDPTDGGDGYTNLAVAAPVTGLLANTTYHYRLDAACWFGTFYGQDLTFTTTAPLAPTLTTLAVSNISATNATLAACVNPEGAPTTVYFAYGTDASYGATNSVSVGGSALPVVVTNLLTNLSPVTTYHFMVIASNCAGMVAGLDTTFQTPLTMPSVTTLAATDISTTGGTLNADINPRGQDTTVYIAYGIDTTYGTTNIIGDIGDGTNDVDISDNLTNLPAGTTYHFMVVASNAGGTVSDGDMTFDTLAIFGPVNSGLSAIDFDLPIAWADYNNDGFLDVLMEGNLWSNNANGTFSQTSFNAGRLQFGSIAWGDVDNDGNLDALITGETVGPFLPSTQLWHNNGDGTFTLMNNTGLPNIQNGEAVFGDFDNDGRQDILLFGATDNDYYNMTTAGGIWHNNGDGTFTQLPLPGLPSIYGASVVAADFDNDGYLDFIVSGQTTNNTTVIETWRNNGNGTFTQMTNSALTPVSSGSISVGDFNNDGKLDLLLTGLSETPSSYGYVSRVWSNAGNWTFTPDNQVSLPGVWFGSGAWGDYDNDGKLDILLAGGTGLNGSGSLSYPIAQIWQNQGGGAFSNINVSLPAYTDNTAVWADFNNDGRLDFLLEGISGNNSGTTLEENQTPLSNTPPTAPSGLQASVTGSGVVLTWNPGSDAQTPAAGLNYNIRVGTATGGVNIVSPLSDPPSGFRRVPQLGNASECLKAILTNLPPGAYYWSVQSIDTAFAGSPFAAEAEFIVAPPGPVAVTGSTGQITSGSAVLNGSVNPSGNDTTAWFQWDTTTNYASNTVSVLVSGTNSGPVTVSLLAGGLAPLTQYYYRMAASNSLGQSYGASSNFTTIATVPPNISQILPQPANAFLLQFTGEPGLGYTLQDSTNLTDWRLVTNLTAGTNGMFQYIGSNSNNVPALYFRLRRP